MGVLFDKTQEIYCVLYDFLTLNNRYTPDVVQQDNWDFDTPDSPTQDWFRMVVRHIDRPSETNDGTQWRRTGEFRIQIATPKNIGIQHFLDLGEEIEALYAGKNLGTINYENVRFYEDGNRDFDGKTFYISRVDGNFYYFFCSDPNSILNP